MSTHYKSLGSS